MLINLEKYVIINIIWKIGGIFMRLFNGEGKGTENEKQFKDLFMKLYCSETEEEITQILEENHMNKEEQWLPYGGHTSNYSIIGNQASSAERALVERITNSIDAFLMRKCFEKDINPREENAPKTTKEAIEKLLDLKGSYLENLDKLNTIMDDSICIYATSKNNDTYKELGNNPHVNIIIYDEGEGQTPKRLPDTILSLLRENKKGIPFTQGTYNQGGSGSLMYCGEKKYCLIISKRNIAIPKKYNEIKDDTIEYWGWTIIREELREGTKEPMFMYYAPNGKIPMFRAEELPLKSTVIRGQEAKDYLNYDKSCSAGIPYSKTTKCGTAIKLFNYSLKQKGPLVSHFKYELGRNILDTYLPIKLIDCRKNKFNNETIFRGLNKLIEDDNGDKENPLINWRFPIENRFYVKYGANKMQKAIMTIYGFNAVKENRKNAKAILGTGEISPIRLVLGEQFQGELQKSYITNAKLGVIKDSLLIIIEFPDIEPEFKKDLFMTDRERLMSKEPKKQLCEYLKTFLTENDTLKEFAEDKMKEILERDEEESIELNNTIKTWIQEDPDIIEALGLGEVEHINKKLNKIGKEGVGTPLSTREHTQLVLGEVYQELKVIPTYFRPTIKEKGGEYYLNVTKDKPISLKFETDAEPDFLDRENNPGKLDITVLGEKIEYSYTPEPGKFKIYIKNKYTNILQDLKLQVNVYTTNKEFQAAYIINVKVKERKLKEAGESTKIKKSIGLPEHKLVYREDWESCDMNEYSGVVLLYEREKEIYLINMDNIYLHAKLDNLSSEAEKEYFKQIYQSYMLICGIVAKAEYDRIKNEENKKYDSEDEAIKEITANASRMVFVMEKVIININKKIAA